MYVQNCYLKSITLTDTNTRVKQLAGQTIKFLPGLNFLVGENGIGKSSILDSLANKSWKCVDFTHKIYPDNSKELLTYFFDTEKMNPRIKGRIDTGFDIACRFNSHGETLMSVLEMIDRMKNETQPHLILIDEPESGISPWNQLKLAKMYSSLATQHQFIIATHSVVMTNINCGQVIELKKKIEYYEPACKFDWHLSSSV